ncbi:hypothetical protein FNU79_02510 [Deinococcus detaillensis]|uniref:Lipoprotein n=1 Tax=Deinococcus detaillensis TaxID=2592048 RepID=A0A553V6L1_9DEIO|nr:hypothetical protein [Deinococcus detaillensis]TSA88115.1 hypothetical protein FNU79_02510 [Deinococcus detaillensis]
MMHKRKLFFVAAANLTLIGCSTPKEVETFGGLRWNSSKEEAEDRLEQLGFSVAGNGKNYSSWTGWIGNRKASVDINFDTHDRLNLISVSNAIYSSHVEEPAYVEGKLSFDKFYRELKQEEEIWRRYFSECGKTYTTLNKKYKLLSSAIPNAYSDLPENESMLKIINYRKSPEEDRFLVEFEGSSGSVHFMCWLGINPFNNGNDLMGQVLTTYERPVVEKINF